MTTSRTPHMVIQLKSAEIAPKVMADFFKWMFIPPNMVMS